MTDIFNLENIPVEVATDLIDLTSILSGIPRNGMVKYREIKFRYCLLDDIVDAIKECKSWAVLTPLREVDGHAEVSAILIHKSGYILKSPSYSIYYSKDAKAQEKAAQITYARRYVLSSFLNIASDDDTDGDDIDGIPTPPPQPQPRTQPKQSPFLDFYKDMIYNFAVMQNVDLADLKRCNGPTLYIKKTPSDDLINFVLTGSGDLKLRSVNELLRRNPLSLGLTDEVLASLSKAYAISVGGKTLKEMTADELAAVAIKEKDTKILSAINYLKRFDPTKRSLLNDKQ